MSPTLNSDDIKLLKTTFTTKGDLVAMEKRLDQKFAGKKDIVSIRKYLISMEKRQDLKYATKKDLISMEKRQDQKYLSKFEQLETIISKAFLDIETEFHTRLNRLEDTVGLSPAQSHLTKAT